MKSNASPQSLRFYYFIAKFWYFLFVSVKCPDSFAASKLATESQNLGINIPQYRYDKSFDLNSADIREGSLQLERQVSSAGASAISKFDLNEFPADMGSPTSHNRIEKIDEAKYNLDFKRKTPEAVDASLIRQENVKPPCQTIELGMIAGSPMQYSKKAMITTKLPTENKFYVAPKTQVPNFFHPHSYWETFPSTPPTNIFIPHEKIYPDVVHFQPLGLARIPGVKIYNAGAKQKTLAADQQSKIGRHIALQSKENPSKDTLDTIKDLIWVEKKKSGPFDIEPKMTNWSPYNRVLFNFLEINLKYIMPGSLNEFIFKDSFLYIIKTFFWKEENGVFFIKEESLSEETFTRNFNSNNKRNPSWIDFSTIGLRLQSDKSPGELFSFRVVFQRLITYENMSEFFFTENIVQKIMPFFRNLKTRLSKKIFVNFRRKEVLVNIFLKRIWLGMTGFLAYVHLINSIIIESDCKMPLTYEQLVEKQEEAFNFFVELHEDAERLCVEQRVNVAKRFYTQQNFNNMSFEDIRKHSIDQILNSNIYNNHRVWIYVELWLIKCRPNLHKIAAQYSTDGSLITNSKFSGLLNKIGVLFFSGFFKHKQNIQKT
ncbi:expressed protein, partial [Phakopsora pachyrhizi]